MSHPGPEHVGSRLDDEGFNSGVVIYVTTVSGIVYNEGSVLCHILDLSMSALDWMMKALTAVW